jgi:hypothetical protein
MWSVGVSWKYPVAQCCRDGNHVYNLIRRTIDDVAYVYIGMGLYLSP